MASLVTRSVILVSGYVYPAYQCFKTVEKIRPDARELQFWCQYWIIISIITILERLGDTFISWLPMYTEAKLAFIIYLWHPKTKGTTYLYATFLRPTIAKHEPEIDRRLNEFKTRAADMAYHYCQRGYSYSQARILDILKYLASQAPPPATPKQTPVRNDVLPSVHQEQQSRTRNSGNDDHLVNQFLARTDVNFQPSAPALPPDYELHSQSTAQYEKAVVTERSHVELNQNVTETVQADLPSISQPSTSASVQRSRSRSRSKMYQP